MEKYSTKINRIGNRWELIRWIHVENKGFIEQPIIFFETKRAAKEAGNLWVQDKKSQTN